MCVIQSHRYPLMWFGPSGLQAWHSDMGDCIMRCYCNVIQFPWAYTLFKDHCQQTMSWCAYYVMGCIGGMGEGHLQWWQAPYAYACCANRRLSLIHCFIVLVQCCKHRHHRKGVFVLSLMDYICMYVALCDFFWTRPRVVTCCKVVIVVWEGSGGERSGKVGDSLKYVRRYVRTYLHRLFCSCLAGIDYCNPMPGGVVLRMWLSISYTHAFVSLRICWYCTRLCRQWQVNCWISVSFS